MYWEQQPDSAKLHFFHETESKLFEEEELPLQIMLVRHGKPELSREDWFTRKEAEAFIRAYDSVGIYHYEGSPLTLESNDVKQFYTSKLRRAIHTAELISEEKVPIVQNELFNEFQRKIISFPNIKMPLGFWLVCSRGFWVMGLNRKGIESFGQAKKRAKLGAKTLEGYAKEEKRTILVAHGFLNKYLRKYLKKRGWVLIKTGGQKHLGVSLLVKKE